jgi:hypothetical protein
MSVAALVAVGGFAGLTAFETVHAVKAATGSAQPIIGTGSNPQPTRPTRPSTNSARPAPPSQRSQSSSATS